MIMQGLLVLFGFIFSIAFSLTVTGLFIYKLKSIYDQIDGCKAISFVDVMSKHSVLYIVSISCTVLSLLSFVIWDITQQNVYAQVIRDYAVLLDQFTNTICIMMTYSFYDRFYKALCFGIDAKLKSIYARDNIVCGMNMKHVTIDSSSKAMDETNKGPRSPIVSSSDTDVKI